MELKGLFTAIVTPFKSDGSLDKDALRKMIEFQVSNNVAGIVPCTVTGESATLSYNEHDWVIELAVKYVNKRILVLASTGSNCTQEAIRLSLHAQKAGSDAVFLVNPYLNTPTQKGLYLHFKTIAEKIDIPCILFNLKAQTNVNLETATLMQLTGECPNIIGICEVGTKLNQAKEILSKKTPNLKLLAGKDDQAIDIIRLGGDGLISVAANIVPDQMLQMIQSAFDERYNTAESIKEKLSDLFNILQLQPDPVSAKTVLSHMKLCEESFRLPICSFEDEKFNAQILKIIKDLKLDIKKSGP
ncbi:MAG: 4-hydroxy-tetrahydrodipicolinate synthase [Deltaproteobacteria bacterium]|nr:4-hydroxy-tetrahydrodipicolinate synthase [Deltaproteobacteria bacterium]